MNLDASVPISLRPDTPANDPSPDASTGPIDIRNKELWFDDGNIVLLTGDGTAESEPTAAFRLYKGVLARASPVFGDLFASAPPDDAEGESFDDCPAVRLTDSPLELGHFLRVLFQAGTTPLRLEFARQRYPFAKLAAIARIAHKYQADTVATDALDRIEQFFLPRTKHWVNFVHPWDECLAKAQVRYALTLAPEDAVQAVNLAHLFDKPLMLPLALYMCCLLGPLKLRNGVQREDGALEKLSDEDFVRCMDAIPVMTREHCSHLQRILDHANGVQPEGCSNPEKCAEGAKKGHLETSTRMCHEAWRHLPQWLGLKSLHGWPNMDSEVPANFLTFFGQLGVRRLSYV
ncbi:hypothetical protein TRAPUB_5741 [Trametes pubescens]|uniref:BTB domain-containing protein n=1 Tax=Trametes pubescens TaxID=154538 RepID=A0A1M2V7K9_TRAPU|nr:hypothetical protein TRAPUB_5741 [Trametes pubescens]